MYSSERLLKLEGKKNLKDLLVQAISLGDKKPSTIDESINTSKRVASASAKGGKRVGSANRIKTVDERLPSYYVRQRSAAKIRERERGIGGYVSQYAHLQQADESPSLASIAKTATGKAMIRMLFVEKLDLIIGASEDANVYVWGFDAEAIRALKDMREQSAEMNKFQEGSFCFVLFFSSKNVRFSSFRRS